MKKKLIHEKFAGKKYKMKNFKVPLNNLLKEKIEKESALLNNYLRGINKILPNLKKMDQFDQFFSENLPYFFKFCRITQPKLAVKIMTFLFTIFKHDFYSKNAERFLCLFYDYINSVDVYHSKSSE